MQASELAMYAVLCSRLSLVHAISTGSSPLMIICPLLRRTAQMAGRTCSALCCAWNGAVSSAGDSGSRCGLFSMKRPAQPPWIAGMESDIKSP